MRVLWLLTALYAFLALNTASADQQFLAAKSQLETMQKNNESSMIVASRNMQLNLYPEKRECVAVVLHGLFQSPKDMQGIINYFYEERGCNVVAPLLAAHWNSNPEAFYKISFHNWKKQTSQILDLSQHLGDKIILVGHSTGGLLAVDKSINSNYNITHLVLFSPAIKLQNRVIWTSKLGAKLRLTQNILPAISEVGEFIKKSEYEMQLRPAIAGTHVQNLIENVFGKSDEERILAYSKIKTPILLISTENDDTIRHDEVINLHNSNTRLFRLIAYSKATSVQHDNIQRSLIDIEPGSPKQWTNPYYKSLLIQISDFLN